MKMAIYHLKTMSYQTNIVIAAPFAITRFIVIRFALLYNVQHNEFDDIKALL